MTTRIDIINFLIKKFNLKSYLEIGVQNKDNCFNKIECDFKVCVDPDPISEATFIAPSDEYFYSKTKLGFTQDHEKFDLIFIDGLHHTDQVDRDIENSLKFLSKKGFIVIHDCNPTNNLMQHVPRVSKVWTGDVWKSIVKFRLKNPDNCVVVDTDFGCVIIFQNWNYYSDDLMPISESEMTYSLLESKRKELLNLITVDEFYNLFDESKN